MAPKFTLRLTLTQLQQLQHYVSWRDKGNDFGWYYGNKEHFEIRHKFILAQIDEAINLATAIRKGANG